MEELSMARLHPHYKPTTLCEVCANACGGCSWSEKDVQKPVEGWDAIRNDITNISSSKDGRTWSRMDESYLVLACPQFELEERYWWAYERFNPEEVRHRITCRNNIGAGTKKAKARGG